MERKKVESLGPTQLEALGQVPDPRSRHGRRHPLPAILTLATCAMLCGCNSLYAIAQWGREPEGLVRTLGFPSGQTPCVATLHLVFKRLDKEAFEEALSGWSQGVLGDGEEAIAIDGKNLRGIHGGELSGVRVVAAYGQKSGLVLGQKGGVERQAKEGELTVAAEVVGQLELRGRTVTGDAL